MHSCFKGNTGSLEWLDKDGERINNEQVEYSKLRIWAATLSGAGEGKVTS